MAADNEAMQAGVPPTAGYREQYPWHAGAWRVLTRDLHRLPHALLLHGRAGLGKNHLALRLANTLLCHAVLETGQLCGECDNCRWFAAGTHPDYLNISSVEDSSVITVDQIRALAGFLTLRPHSATRKVVIISPAEAMNLQAANCLLKMLEEPPATGVLVLVAQEPARLPPTIRSRCVAIRLTAPARAHALAWLADRPDAPDHAESLLDLAGGAPLQALALQRSGFLPMQDALRREVENLRAGREDPVACAARWRGRDVGACLAWFQTYLVNAIKMALSIPVDQRDSAQTKPYEIREMLRVIDAITEARSLAATPLDTALLLEDVLISWARPAHLTYDRLHSRSNVRTPQTPPVSNP